jgi:hypothetical protein
MKFPDEKIKGLVDADDSNKEIKVYSIQTDIFKEFKINYYRLFGFILPENAVARINSYRVNVLLFLFSLFVLLFYNVLVSSLAIWIKLEVKVRYF